MDGESKAQWEMLSWLKSLEVKDHSYSHLSFCRDWIGFEHECELM